MIRKSLLVISVTGISLLLTGCFTPYTYTPPPPTVYLNQYDPLLTKALNDKVGNGKVTGSAFLRQGGGGVVTCAGNEVVLFPKTPYATEYLENELISNSSYFPGWFSNGIGYKKSIGAYVAHPNSEFEKTTICDAQGNFEFNKIGDGEYYISTVVYWEVARKSQGGKLVQYVKIQNNETKKVVLSQ